MSYEPTTWKSGDTVTSAKLNKMEQGIANAGGGGALVVTATEGTLNKTWQEIHDAAPLVSYYNPSDGQYRWLTAIGAEGSEYWVTFDSAGATASSADGYPVLDS